MRLWLKLEGMLDPGCEACVEGKTGSYVLRNWTSGLMVFLSVVTEVLIVRIGEAVVVVVVVLRTGYSFLVRVVTAFPNFDETVETRDSVLESGEERRVVGAANVQERLRMIESARNFMMEDKLYGGWNELD